jgi:sortase A
MLARGEMQLRVIVPRNRVRRAIRLLLLVIGIACLGVFCYSYAYRTAFQLYEGWRFDHETAAAPVEESGAVSGQKTVSIPVVRRNVPRGDALGIIGRISVPRLHLSVMVEEGVDEATLGRAAGHIPGTALPGEAGNVGIAGHRDTLFRALRELHPHDAIEVTTHTGHYRYNVESLTIVDPSDVTVLQSDGSHTLTLVTCFPFQYIGNAPRRFIVRAVSQ